MTLPRGCDAMAFFPNLVFYFVSVAVKPTLLFTVAIKFFAKLGMGDLDECLSALPDIAAVEVSNAVFGDDVVHITPSGQHARAQGKPRYDARDRFVLGGRWKRNDGLAIFGPRRSANEIELPAKAAIELVLILVNEYLNYDCFWDKSPCNEGKNDFL